MDTLTHQAMNFRQLLQYKQQSNFFYRCTVHFGIYKVHTPTNALFNKFDKVLKFTLKITSTCSYMFRSFSKTIIREPSSEPSWSYIRLKFGKNFVVIFCAVVWQHVKVWCVYCVAVSVTVALNTANSTHTITMTCCHTTAQNITTKFLQNFNLI